jgi:phosphatidylglycerol:prolipoprotein diacylglycerol transferase
MLGSSLIVGWFLAMRLAKEDGIPNEQAASIYMWTAVWSIVGARVLYVITNLDTFDSPLDAFMVHKGGLVAYGGMIGGFFASWYGCRKRKIPLLKWADVSAPSVVLGTGITRIGCLLYGCDYGKRTDLAWALTFPKNSPAWDDHVKTYQLAEDALRSFPVHPTQIYESVVGFALFGLLMYLRKVRRFSGLVFVGWVVGYGIMRPLIEILRDDDQRGAIGPLSTSQFIGVTATLFGVALLVSLLRRHREDPTSLRLWETPLEVEVPARAMPAPAVRRRKKRR